MLALRLTNIDFSYGARKIIKIPSLAVYDGERVGLIGINGSGKSTVLDIIAGLIETNPGRADLFMGISYFKQGIKGFAAPNAEMLSYFDAKEGLVNPSGGEQTRYKLASAFSQGSGLLLLDEPTTNLDLDGILLLREAIKAWDGPVVIVTHDEALLSEVCGRILAIRAGRLVDFPGGYDAWLDEEEVIKDRAAHEYTAYLKQRRHILRAMQEAMASSKAVKKVPSRMGNSEARLHKAQSTESSEKLAMRAKALLSRLNRLKAAPRPVPDRELAMAFSSPSADLPRFAAIAQEMDLEVGGRLLLSKASFQLPTGTKTFLLGPNGCGKTSLIRRMEEKGDRIVSRNVRVATMEQDLADLDDSSSALDNCKAASKRGESSIRTVLARLRIAGDMVHTPVGMMSGGERMKVSLARLMLSEADLLMLDEPTNHMDIESSRALAEVLVAWPGTLLAASHDRAFIDSVADRIIVWNKDKLVTHEGNYSDYEHERLGLDQLEMLASDMNRAYEASKAILEMK